MLYQIKWKSKKIIIVLKFKKTLLNPNALNLDTIKTLKTK